MFPQLRSNVNLFEYVNRLVPVISWNLNDAIICMINVLKIILVLYLKDFSHYRIQPPLTNVCNNNQQCFQHKLTGVTCVTTTVDKALEERTTMM